MAYYRLIFLCGILVISSLTGFSQTTDWNLVGGKAIAEKKITIPGKTQSDIYKEVYRWLIKVYKDPEDILKARIENEYIRGVGHNSNFLMIGAMSSGDLQYNFEFEIKHEEVLFKISNAILIYSYEDGAHPIENYLIIRNAKKYKENDDAEKILATLNTFSESLFDSFENHLIIK